MFDIGFWELALIAVVALLVVGPERLPQVARTAGLWIGRTRKFVASVKADVDREIKSEELKRILEEQRSSMTQIHEIIDETRADIEAADSDEPQVKAIGGETGDETGEETGAVEPETQGADETRDEQSR